MTYRQNFEQNMSELFHLSESPLQSPASALLNILIQRQTSKNEHRKLSFRLVDLDHLMPSLPIMFSVGSSLDTGTYILIHVIGGYDLVSMKILWLVRDTHRRGKTGSSVP